MSLKSIELQVALPRTFEAGKISEQLQQRGQALSDQATSEMAEKVERNRQSVIKSTQKDELQLKDHSSKGQDEKGQQEKQSSKKQEKLVEKVHPYKGNTIDYSG